MRFIVMTAALALVPALAAAQAAGEPAPANWFDFGIRGTSFDGDSARYERYRDLGDGLFLERARLRREYAGWFVDVDADHVGRRDQRYTGRFVLPGRFTGWAQWDQIPMLMSNSTRSVFSGIGSGVLTIDDSVQGRLGGDVALFEAAAVGFDTRSRRHIFESGVDYLVTPELTLNAEARVTNREGAIPFGGSFGHSVLVETVAPVNHTTTDVDAGAEFARDRLLVRVGYTASVFHNDNTTLQFDNPFTLTDTANLPSRGRASLAQNSTQVGVNGLVSVQLPRRSRASAYVSLGSLKDAGDPIMPFTSNSLSQVLPYSRPTIEGEARTTATNLAFTSRPTRMLSLDVRFRSYDYDNRTPEFAITQYEAYDGSPSTISSQVCGVGDAVCTEPFGVLRRTFDADARITPVTGAAFGVGYSRLNEERTHRIFASTNEDVVRLTFDSLGTSFVMLRTKYEHSAKRGKGFDVQSLEHAGEQPGMRHFDVASRDRDRVTLLNTFMVDDNVAINASVAVGKDDYTESEFGLRDNTHRVLSLGFDAAPGDDVVVASSYSYERYQALSRSRQANPGAEFNDPSRNWATEATDRVHSFLMSVDATSIRDRVDLGVSYDFNRARAFYVYTAGSVPNRTLPEEVIVTTTLPDPEQLPPTLSQLSRLTADLTYWATSRLGIGVSYWLEDYNVEDFTLDVESTPNLLRGNTLLLGYLYRPYTANTVWGRIFYRW
jgi:MtrB/PioB family decaheme-associated outer membrane protein